MKFFLQAVVIFLFLVGGAICCSAAEIIQCVVTMRGMASWYGEDYRGRPMADGKPFDPDALTCASWIYPFGTRLLVSHGDSEVIVTVTDRGPRWDLFDKGVVLDLSARAFAAVANPRDGVVPVTIKTLR